jgi:glycosyltransferase involved in cell wall biosynthesis
VQTHDCGFVIEPGQSKILADTILRLHDEPDLRDVLGRRARAMIEQHFTREQAFSRWRDLLGHH